MAAERAAASRDTRSDDLQVTDAPEAEAPSSTRFSAHGTVPGVSGGDEEASSRPSASEMAYDDAGNAIPYIAGDIMYEQLAHRFAYRDTLTKEDHDWLKVQGLKAGKVVKGKNGFAMIAFTPLPGFDGKRRPVLAFRGSDDMKDALDDFNHRGVGAAQMAANEGLIGAALVGLQQYAKEPAVTGHSLGGALAQMAAARFPDLVAKVVTFQSPGISGDMAKHVTDANKKSNAAGKGDTVVSHHYQVNGDLVGKSGEALTEGEVSDINRPTGYLLKHTGYVTDYAEAHPESRTKSDASERMPGKLEGLRKGFGKFLGAIQKVTHSGPEQYIEVWTQVRDAIDRDAKAGEIRAIIDRSKLSKDDKSWMHEQLNDTLAANDFEQQHGPEADIATAE